MKRTEDAWTWTITCWKVSDASTGNSSAEDDDDESAQTYVMHHVEIRCYWVGNVRPAPSVTAGPGRAQRAAARSAGTEYQGRWVAERSVRSRLISASERSKLAEAGATVLADSIGKRAFRPFTDRWVVQDPGGAAAVSGLADSAQAAIHQFVLGDPATKVCRALGVPGGASCIIGEVAGELPLGIDGLFDTIKTMVLVGGMVIGVATGVPLIHVAACKAFVHDQFTRGLTREFDEALRGGSERGRPTSVGQVQPGQTTRIPAGITREEEQRRREEEQRRRWEEEMRRRREEEQRRRRERPPRDSQSPRDGRPGAG